MCTTFGTGSDAISAIQDCVSTCSTDCLSVSVHEKVSTTTDGDNVDSYGDGWSEYCELGGEA